MSRRGRGSVAICATLICVAAPGLAATPRILVRRGLATHTELHAAPTDRSRFRGRTRAASARDQALAVFDIEPPLTVVRLKARYKVLVKLHHPDANGGDKAAEEKLKIINQAYATLKASYFA